MIRYTNNHRKLIVRRASQWDEKFVTTDELERWCARSGGAREAENYQPGGNDATATVVRKDR